MGLAPRPPSGDFLGGELGTLVHRGCLPGQCVRLCTYVWCVPSMHYVLSPTLQSYTPARMKKHAFSLGYILSSGLQLNVAKTKCMPFRSSRRIPTSTLEVQLNGRTIDRVQRYKFLGVIITDPLSWSDHIDQVCSKASRCLNLLRRLA